MSRIPVLRNILSSPLTPAESDLRTSDSKLRTLLFCLDYAQQGGLGVAGVWKAVANIFADTGMEDLYDDLKKVNEIRNRHVAHSEAPLDDPEKAVEAMGDWVRCVNRMVKITV